jgi:16S rRNA (guanine1516-N2)-methyltransferase
VAEGGEGGAVTDVPEGRRAEPRADVDVVDSADGLELRLRGEPRGVSLDLDEIARRLRQGRRLALARACGARPGLDVLDAMAGIGTDGVLLACLGCVVTAVEFSPAIHRVLVDGVDRAARRFEIGDRVSCVRGDAIELLRSGRTFDVVYLDPMFPARSKGALPKRKAQVLAAATASVGIADEALLSIARRCARERVVVKRRARDRCIAPPDWQILGNRVRYDVYRGVGGTAVASRRARRTA